MTNKNLNPINVKEQRGKIIRKLFSSPRMNQYVILFDMLNYPLERFGTAEYLGKISNDNLYIMQSFRVLEKKSLIESVGFFSKEKMFQISSEHFVKVTEYLLNKMCKYLTNSKIEVSYVEFFKCFEEILYFDEQVLLCQRVERVQEQIRGYPNDAVLINILNKLNERLLSRMD